MSGKNERFKPFPLELREKLLAERQRFKGSGRVFWNGNRVVVDGDAELAIRMNRVMEDWKPIKPTPPCTPEDMKGKRGRPRKSKPGA